MPTLKVPTVIQETSYSCGAACLRCVLEFWGQPLSEHALRKMLGIAKNGYDPGTLASQALTLGYEVVFQQYTATTLREEIRRGIPVILLLQSFSSLNPDTDDDGHYVVCYGYRPDGIMVMDPAVGRKRFVGTKTLHRHWHWTNISSDGKHLLRYGIAVRRP